MTLQQLRCMVAAAKYQSFHRAAEHLFITQPSVTHQIRQLERELGTQLFDRSQRKTVLTAAGGLFYEDAVDILDRVELAAQRVRTTSNESSLNVVCEGAIQIPELPGILTRFHEEMPQVLINLTEEDRATSRSLLQKRMADVTIAPLNALSDLQDVRCLALGRGKQHCVMPAEHPLSGSKGLAIEDFSGQTLVIPDTYHCPPELRQFYRTIQEQAQQVRFCHAGSPRQAVEMVRAGLGIAVFPEYAMPDILGLAMVPVICGEPMELAAAWNCGGDRAAVRCLIRILKETLGA